MSELTKEQIVEHYNMQPHPEGGFYVETYRSELKVNPSQGERAASTAILFLITEDSISHLHRLTSDEGWHFHLGAPLKIVEITPDGELIETVMGNDIEFDEKIQHIVPAGNWFGSTSLGEYSLVGCTVSPGFDFDDFEMGKKAELLEKFPQLEETIEEFALG